MIYSGRIQDTNGYDGYASVATQEEAERLSNGEKEEGIIIFMPFSHIFHSLEYYAKTTIKDAD